MLFNHILSNSKEIVIILFERLKINVLQLHVAVFSRFYLYALQIVWNVVPLT